MTGRTGRTVPLGRKDSFTGFQPTTPECPDCYATLPRPYPGDGSPDFSMWECWDCGCIWDTDGREEL